MARPKQFDDASAIDAATLLFWSRGYEATSTRDLAESMGISGASLYNTFGDKRTLYRLALDRYIERGLCDRIKRYETQLAPRDAIVAFLDEIVELSLADSEHKGCFIVNSALELAPHDPEFQDALRQVLCDMEHFFLRCVRAGQTHGTINTAVPAADLARMLLSVLMGLRVLARSRPERSLLQGVIRPIITLLDVNPHPQP